MDELTIIFEELKKPLIDEKREKELHQRVRELLAQSYNKTRAEIHLLESQVEQLKEDKRILSLVIEKVCSD